MKMETIDYFMSLNIPIMAVYGNESYNYHYAGSSSHAVTL